MEYHSGHFWSWVICTTATLLIGAGFDLFAVTVVSSLVVAAIWAVFIFGGVLILDDLDGIF